MKEKIEAKIDEIIDYIITKDPSEITYNEFRILDARRSAICYEVEMKRRQEEMIELTSKVFAPSITPPGPLPDPE